MARGETSQAKVHLKGQQDDYLVFVDDVEAFKKWSSGDKTVPLAHFVSSFQVFRTHNQGAQGTYDAAAKGTLESEFGTSVDDEVIKIILEKGTLQTSEMPERTGSKNDTMGSMIAH
ncbi:ribosome maturation protein [Dactylonectria estremocensis]|uniref:Ribosome maturation protein n=1 Tax=Dactylonectria estremocensis TaxID=1079267 RepID=A0A9P9IXB1_9HYPO|nr:ribosome maturation protein [Dactylonectria estremocensis]